MNLEVWCNIATRFKLEWQHIKKEKGHNCDCAHQAPSVTVSNLYNYERCKKHGRKN